MTTLKFKRGNVPADNGPRFLRGDIPEGGKLVFIRPDAEKTKKSKKKTRDCGDPTPIVNCTTEECREMMKRCRENIRRNQR